MGAFIVVVSILAAVTFGYLVYRAGWKEAVAATVVLFGSLWAAVEAFTGNFAGIP